MSIYLISLGKYHNGPQKAKFDSPNLTSLEHISNALKVLNDLRAWTGV